MMKFIEGLAIALLIATVVTAFGGCSNDWLKPAAESVPLQTDPTKEAIEAYATLSDSSNPADMAASVVYTRLAMFRRLAAKKLRAGDIGVADAKYCQARADAIRADLDRALANRDLASIRDQADKLGVESINLEMRHAH